MNTYSENVTQNAHQSGLGSIFSLVSTLLSKALLTSCLIKPSFNKQKHDHTSIFPSIANHQAAAYPWGETIKATQAVLLAQNPQGKGY